MAIPICIVVGHDFHIKQWHNIFLGLLKVARTEQHFTYELGWSKIHPLGLIAHPLQVFRSNGLIDYFSLFYSPQK